MCCSASALGHLSWWSWCSQAAGLTADYYVHPRHFHTCKYPGWAPFAAPGIAMNAVVAVAVLPASQGTGIWVGPAPGRAIRRSSLEHR